MILTETSAYTGLFRDRAALLKHSDGKTEAGYSQPQGGMNYQQPGQNGMAYQNGQKY